MILKIERIAAFQEWWIFDSIRKISIGKVRQITFADLNEGGQCEPDVFLIDRFNDSQINGESQSHFKYRELILRLDSGEELSVAFDTVAYLCNDVGKTIEKITV